METQLIGYQAVKLLSQLTGQNLTVSDVTPQIVFMTDLIALLRGVIHADQKATEEEIALFKQTLNKLNLNNQKTIEVTKLLLSGIQKLKLYADIDNFLILLVPLSDSEKLLLFGLGYRMAMADSNLDEAESKYLRNLGDRLEIEPRYLDVLESSFKGNSYNAGDLQELCELVDPARFHDLGTVFVNAADNLKTALSEIIYRVPVIEVISEPVVQTSLTSTGGEYQKLQEFQIRKRSLLDQVNHLSLLIDNGIDESLLPITFRDDIQAIKHRLESQRFRIAVIGEFSQGKSTLLNALLGEEIQPVRAIPCSGSVSVLRYGDRKRVICRYIDGREEEIPIEAYQEKTEIPLEAALENRSDELLKNDLLEIVFEHPNLALCRNGVEIVDSPGLNDHPARSAITAQILKNIDAVIFLTSAAQALSQGERDIIKDLQRQIVGDNITPLTNLFLIVNFIDLVRKDKDLQQLQALVNIFGYGKTPLLSGENRIHFISAQSALDDILEGNSGKYSQSFHEFKKAIERFLTDEQGAVMFQNITQKLNDLTQACVNDLNAAMHSVETKLPSSYKQEILEKIGEASGRFTTITKMVKILKQRTVDSAWQSWDQEKQLWKSEVLERSKKSGSRKGWQTQHNPIFSRDALIQDYVNQFSSTLQEVINEWAIKQLSNVIIPKELAILDKGIQEELSALNSSFSNLDAKIGTKFEDSFKPTFNNFDASYVVAFAAGGGVIGGGAAAAAFFLIPALALGPAIIIGIVAAAILSGTGLVAAMADAYYQIANQVCEAGFQEFEKAEEIMKPKIAEFVSIPFLDRAEAVAKLIKQVISECENSLELEERKHQGNLDQLRSSISTKKQDFEKLLPQ